MGNLTENLTTIYNTKLAIKEAIGTQSDVFTEYPSYITALKPSGTSYITTNGEHNVSSYAYAYVTVEGEGGGSGGGNNPLDSLDSNIILEGTTEGENLGLRIDDNFCAYFEGNPVSSSGYSADQIEFDTTLYGWDDIQDQEITYTGHVVLTDPDGVGNWAVDAINEVIFDNEDYLSELYHNLYIVVNSWTATESSDPSNDGYDWLIECEGLDAINPTQCTNTVEEITENGFFLNNGAVGFNVDVSGGGGITPSGTSYISTNGTHDVSSYAYAYVNVPNNGVVLSGGEYWHVSPIDADTSINISQSANSYINIVSFNEYNVESEDGMTPGNNFTALTVKDTNGTMLADTYGTTAFNEGESVTLTLQSATTICLYKYYWVWNTEPGDPEMGVPDSFYLDVSHSEPICAGTNNGYILENLPAGTYTIIVKWGYQGNNDIVILNHINVSDQCVASSNQYFEI